MLVISSKNCPPLHVQLYNKIRRQILSGNLPAHAKLASVRLLSLELSLSKNTVEYAYEQLCTEGFIYSKPRSGYYVSALDPEFVLSPQKKRTASIDSALSENEEARFDFHPAGISSDSFSVNIWRKLVTETLSAQPEQFSVYGTPQGEPGLRNEIQRYLERFRGVSCDAAQIVICCGLHDNLSIIAQLLRKSHVAVAVEEPGHWLPRTIFQNFAFSVNHIPVAPDGINLQELRKTDSTVVYVTPSHQFPLGCVMPVENRLQLINWAKTTDGFIIEDDYDSELRYHGSPIPALQGLNPAGNIIYIGTFSKVLSPALRTSYMVLPYQLLDTYHAMFGDYAPSVPLLEQCTLREFMAQGYWDRHLRRMRTLYRKKHDAIIQSLTRHLAENANILGQGAGLHVVLDFPGNTRNEHELITLARKKGVRIFPISHTYHHAGDRVSQVMLGFGKMAPEELETGIKLLKQALYPA